MIRRLRFSESDVRPLLARLAPVVPAEFVVAEFVVAEFVVAELSLLLERSERIDEEDDGELLPVLEGEEELGVL